MKSIERIHVILRMVQESPGIGKTAIMKCLYLMQTLSKVPLNYDFEIYTYGPYSSTVMDEIDCARQIGLIDVKGVVYSAGFGYSIECSEHGKAVVNTSQIVSDYSAEIDAIVSEFGKKSASELELLSTILFVYNMCENKSEDNVCTIVRGIKPKFTIDEIQDKYKYLQEKKHLH